MPVVAGAYRHRGAQTALRRRRAHGRRRKVPAPFFSRETRLLRLAGANMNTLFRAPLTMPYRHFSRDIAPLNGV